MRSVKLGLLIIAASPLSSTWANEPELVLDLSDALTWKSVFDAGFRPHHERSGRFACGQRNIEFGIRLGRNSPVMQFGSGDIKFSLVENHLLILAVYYGREQRTFSEARASMKAFVDLFGEKVTRSGNLRVYTNGNVDIGDAESVARVGDWSIIHGFSRTGDKKMPVVERVSLALKAREVRFAKRMSEKISPPPGYEDVSLEPVVPITSGTNQKAPVDAAMASGTGVASGAVGGGESSSVDGWRAFLFGLFALLLCGGCLLAFRKTRANTGDGR